MASSINPNNIDTTYPVAGQDNDSQGFRDNFTNLKTNFTYAKSEIEDLQSKAVLKSALSGTTLDNDFAGSTITAAKMTDMRLTTVDKGTVDGSITIDIEAGGHQTVDISGTGTGGTGAISLAFSNFPAAGAFSTVRLSILAEAGESVTLPATVSPTTAIGISGFDGTDTITFAEDGTFDFEFFTYEGGSANNTISIRSLTAPKENLRLNTVGWAAAPTNDWTTDGSDNLPAGPTAVSLSESVTYFSTDTTAAALTLADGVEGQTKTLVMVAHGTGGDVTLTIASTDTGTVVFDDAGQTLSLVFVGSKWYVTGSYGCTIN